MKHFIPNLKKNQDQNSMSFSKITSRKFHVERSNFKILNMFHVERLSKSINLDKYVSRGTQNLKDLKVV